MVSLIRSLVSRSALASLCLAASLVSATAGELAVDVANSSFPTACAEYDNVYLTLRQSTIRRFEIAARHPLYIATLDTDRSEADFTGCSFSGDPQFSFTPKSATLYQDERMIVRGHTTRTNWRPEKVGLTVRGATTPELHLVQLFQNLEGEWVEVLAVYPSDGYWRIKPLPPFGWDSTTYGSSFLVGPIEEDGRPLVRFSRLSFEPENRTFHFGFTAGGSGSLRIISMAREELRVEVTLESEALAGRPFAALRSMYVARDDNDVAEAHWRVPGQVTWRMSEVMKMPDTAVVAARFGRSLPSVHNTSAPDMSFERFED
jgi:hypothetical protein